MGLYEAASGGLWGFPGTFKASPDVLSRLLSFALSRMLTKNSFLTCLPFQLFQVCWGQFGPVFAGFVNRPFRSRCVSFLNKFGPYFGADGRFTSPSTLCCAPPWFFLICLELSKNALVRSFALLVPAGHF